MNIDKWKGVHTEGGKAAQGPVSGQRLKSEEWPLVEQDDLGSILAFLEYFLSSVVIGADRKIDCCQGTQVGIKTKNLSI